MWKNLSPSTVVATPSYIGHQQVFSLNAPSRMTYLLSVQAHSSHTRRQSAQEYLKAGRDINTPFRAVGLHIKLVFFLPGVFQGRLYTLRDTLMWSFKKKLHHDPVPTQRN